jgi:nucleoside-diphosphate-sugar epimerase
MTATTDLPQGFDDEIQLEEFLTRPTPALVEDMRQVDGDLMLLGVGGKMGPTLARLARRAFTQAGKKDRVIGVSRFSSPGSREALESAGVETRVADLVELQDLRDLPDCPNIVFMVGTKFGTTGSQATTWAMNTLVPGYVADRYRASRFVVFSTGNVYPFTRPASGGPLEEEPVGPVGEYAQSALGRERVFEYFSRRHGTPVAIFRLNYAVDLRYGVLVDIAQKVHGGIPIDLSMGHFNTLWQGDANEWALRCLLHAESPPNVFNVTGAETLSVRETALRLGEILGREPVFEGSERETSLLSNAAKAHSLFGPPQVPIETLLSWVSDWIKRNGPTLGKPTHFETRDGKF